MKRLIMGTAGHIDHGKTALVRMLTGTDTDRLEEEKRRGITIVLGFAHLELPDGSTVGIVDVPGHEKFVRTMVAGAGGIDLVCLVVAADEGVMPQTVEHFQICRLLRVKKGVVVLTKSDLVDDEWLALVRQDVEKFVADSFLEGAPIVPVSSTTGQGKQALLEVLGAVAKTVEPPSESTQFRLPVDRVFTMKGFGTVVTGSGVGGRVAVGDQVEILPAGTRAKVRGLQVHNETVEVAGAGWRTAVNFQGLEKDQVKRGDVLVKPGSLRTTYLVDARVEMLSSAPKALAPRMRVRFDHLASEILARVIPLSGPVVPAGSTGAIQLRLESPAVVLPGDRFVLRSYSPMMTIGGGVVLHPRPAKHKSPFDRALADLKILEQGDLAQRMALMFRSADKEGLRLAELGALLGNEEKGLLVVYRDLLGKGELVRFDTEEEAAVYGETFARLRRQVLDFLENFHSANPTLEGVSRKILASKVEYGISDKLLNRILAKLDKENKIRRSADSVALFSHKASLQGGLESLGKTILELLEQNGYMPPGVKELVKQTGQDPHSVRKVVDLLVKEGKIVRVSEDLYFDGVAMDRLRERLCAYLEKHGEIDAQGFKTLSGASRKFAIPLLEFFDGARVTLRVGDKRILRKSGKGDQG